MKDYIQLGIDNGLISFNKTGLVLPTSIRIRNVTLIILKKKCKQKHFFDWFLIIFILSTELNSLCL